MTRLAGAVLLVLTAIALGWLLTRDAGANGPVDTWTIVEVQRGDLAAVLREVGELSPRDPLPIKMPLKGRLEWMVEEGVWVEAGDDLFIVNEEEALNQVTELRGELVAAQQELALARMRREQAEVEENQKVAAAERKLALEDINYRIIATQPKGGDELIRLHEQLVPKEAAAKTLRHQYERALHEFQQVENTYLDAYDAWQDAKDSILRTQARLDELTVRRDAGEANEEDLADISEGEGEVRKQQERLPVLAASRDELGDQREAKQQLLHAAFAELEAAEKGMEDLFIAIEVEKRGQEMARLQIELELAELDLEEAQEELAAAERSLTLGAISASKVTEWRSTVIEKENALAIVKERLAIASRPAPVEELTEAKMRLQRAEVRAGKARKVRDRALKKLDLDAEVKQARLAKLEHQISTMARNFPAVIENTIAYLSNQLAQLDPKDSETRLRLERELTEAKAALVTAEQQPPNIVRAPVDGVVRIAEKDQRAIQVGDELDLREVVLEVKPLGNMEVVVAVNEVHVQRIQIGMPVTLTVPALPDRSWTGSVRELAGAGRDKFASYGRWGTDAFAGVTQFDARIAIDDVAPEFRQGMTVLVAVQVDQLRDVAHIPRAAVQRHGDDYVVQVDAAGATRIVQGGYFGDDHFIIDSGLAVGEAVYVRQAGREDAGGR